MHTMFLPCMSHTWNDGTEGKLTHLALVGAAISHSLWLT